MPWPAKVIRSPVSSRNRVAMAEALHADFLRALAAALLGLASIVVAVLAVRTVVAATRGEIGFDLVQPPTLGRGLHPAVAAFELRR